MIKKLIIIALCPFVIGGFFYEQYAKIEIFGRNGMPNIILDVPSTHRPQWYEGPNVNEIWFTFKDSSYLYFMGKGLNPNYSRMKNVTNAPSGDTSFFFDKVIHKTVRAVDYKGIDSRNKYWRNISYYYSDTIDREMPRHTKPQIISHRFTLGYANVGKEKKEIFDHSIKNFIFIKPPGNAGNAEEGYSIHSGFKYVLNGNDVVDTLTTPLIDPYEERKKK